MQRLKNRKKLQAISPILALALFAAGCGSGTTGSNAAKDGEPKASTAASTAPAASASPVEIEFWQNGDKTMDKLVEEYNLSQTKVKVKSIAVPNYYDGIVEKLQVQAVAKKLPDVSIMGLLYTRFADETMHAVPLEPLMKQDKYDTGDFFPSMLNLGKTSDGTQIGIPGGISTPILFYNADQFREAGLNPDTPPKTWDELREYAKKLTTDARHGIFAPIRNGWTYQAVTQTFGGSMMAPDGKAVGLDSQASVKAVQYFADLVNADKSMPLLQELQSYEAMAKGNISMLVSSGAALGIIRASAKFDLSSVPFPTKDGNRSVAAGGYNYMIFSTDKAKQEASWDFIKYMTDTKQSVRVTKATGYMVARKSALNDPEMAQYLKDNPAASATYEQVDQMVPWFNFPGKGGTKVQKIIADQIDAALEKQKPVEQAMKDAAEQANALIK